MVTLSTGKMTSAMLVKRFTALCFACWFISLIFVLTECCGEENHLQVHDTPGMLTTTTTSTTNDVVVADNKRFTLRKKLGRKMLATNESRQLFSFLNRSNATGSSNNTRRAVRLRKGGSVNYLYTAKDAYPVIDYHKPDNSSEDSSLVDDDDPYGNSTHPGFLFSPHNGPRMVEFYAAWCPHCRNFRNGYVQLARQLYAVSRDQTQQDDFIKVYAVACNVHHSLCQAFGIKGYPNFRLFQANSTEPIPIRKGLGPAVIVEKLGLKNMTARKAVVQGDLDPFSRPKSDTAGGSLGESDDPAAIAESRHTTRLGLNKEDVFLDAYLSLEYSLRHEVFAGQAAGAPLPPASAVVLREWLELLRHRLPAHMGQTTTLLAALLDHFEEVQQSEQHLLNVLNRHSPSNKEWSPSCTKGGDDVAAGYTCGLWQLFHIMTVGVVEWNVQQQQVSNNSNVVAPAEAARRLRDYIAHFFGCEVCRTEFVQAFDACALDRCHRLGNATTTTTTAQWQQLPLWLFETHNAVNLRLAKERAEREHQSWSLAENATDSQWPSHHECPKCWRPDPEEGQQQLLKGGWWDEAVVYQYLRTEYYGQPNNDVAETFRKVREVTGATLLHNNQAGVLSPQSFVQWMPLFVVVGVGTVVWCRKKLVARSKLVQRSLW